MPRAGVRVRDGVLTYCEGTTEHSLPVGGDAWERWLERPGTRTFRFEDGTSGFTARRELQRGHWYWYAYRRRSGRLRKAYLGRAADLTRDLLKAICARLDVAADAVPVPGQPAPASDSDRHNLPGELSSFLGRQGEIVELRGLLASTRLLTLTGTGGVGKTRLALHLAQDVLDDATSSVWLVELAALADGALVARAVAQAVGVREEPGRSLRDALPAALNGDGILLVLDNCEHLVDACAELVQYLLRACPVLRILATSREPLAVPGEVTRRVPSLRLPEPDAGPEQLALSEAVQLFMARAHAARPEFALTERTATVVAEVCRRLDGIPLAIELAAARVRVLSPGELVARLDDRFRVLAGGSRTAPARQQTIAATVAWSYDLLTEPERRLFERLSVFAGGFTLDAAEAVGAWGAREAAEVLDLLTRLVDRSLVVAEPEPGTATTRYRMLETLRAYGLDRLAERDEVDRVRELHARWITELAQQAERAFHGPEQGRWLHWAERELDNARAALGWAVAREETELATCLAAALSWPWVLQQRWSEGLEWAERVLALPYALPTREQGLLRCGAIQFALFRGDLTSNRPSGELAAVRHRIEEVLAIGETLGDDELVLAAYGMSQLLREFGVVVEGAPEVTDEEVQVLAHRIGDTWGECRGLEALARHALHAGDLDTAAARLEEAVRLARGAGDTWSLAMALNQLGDIERARGAHPRAGVLYAESLALFAELGLVVQPSIVHNLGYVVLAAGEFAEATGRFTEALRQFRRLGEVRGMAECLIGLGAVAAAEGRTADAGRLTGAGEAALEAAGMAPWPVNRPDAGRWLVRVQRGRAAATFSHARAEGSAFSLEEAVSRALEQRGAGSIAAPVRDQGPPLTPREQEVSRLAARGLTNRQIADVLVIAEKTVANHLQRALEKLDLHSRTQLAARAADLGIVPAGEAPPAADTTR